MELVRYADRPDLRAIRHAALSAPAFPEFAHHFPAGNRWWGRLYDRFPDFQYGLLDDGELVAELHSAPLARCGPIAATSGCLPGCWTRCARPAAEQACAS